ncbi:7-cyano-7-deazaguanine synthase QueC [candidate division WOR-1 bacterium RIFOXYC2_FULL_37_10]|uniref:7-cyano-7-deazaguanine synthase n=1 Tax=candidate division WOR-1 bacterium RIFOXYB2_FULL_37_13 TaxID=1802579 RepID=A0A1F4SY19_UNCSA|nr:MAG: 7-cyano-7-deazaguanine synthase QueC [candidate division WOR-1 bacterium RIFOXYA2_FULL_37_7]OGC24633.1 MAG: 7-cyano-7-deazaguanine synthase QueC [candidate division WOR-1 bacterium RIFOXYB2_FULL_37_13]OGC36097.1 MAG: 7-cyano-7-deazaguanine synthase QueC [candidate division WOR-1 bacterium RIFOXYC2_FULL_37_10]
MNAKKSIILLSGGLDSATTLYYAKDKGYNCYVLIFDYGQRHKREIKSAVEIARQLKVPYQIVKIVLPWKGSALTDASVKIPIERTLSQISKDIPATYVPGRNTIFLSFALSYAEAIGAKFIFIGANVIDYSGYPDCRPQFLEAFQRLIKKGARDTEIAIKAPLIRKTKLQILKMAMKLGVPIDKTWSCYSGGETPCGVCDSCLIRNKAFSIMKKKV